MSEQHLCASAGCFHLRGHAGPHSWNRAAVAPPSAPKCNCHLHENTVCDICQGVGGKDVAPPETTAPTATETCTLCFGRGWYYVSPGLSKGCPRCHPDSSLPTVEDVRRALGVSPVASSATPTPEPTRSMWNMQMHLNEVNATCIEQLNAALASSQQEVAEIRRSILAVLHLPLPLPVRREVLDARQLRGALPPRSHRSTPVSADVFAPLRELANA